ncbi:S-layer homology domain-containing protein [Brevibacillus sp. SYSU BS000544]|uniref:S-layer homology domain-containing protein n=1 Tax=Brevibacillus sp. SYSU BS000544 TaxID=3416443 RepID=UPI003CE4C08E
MLRKLLVFFFVFALLVPTASVGASTTTAAPVFKDLQGHWAKEYVDYLSALGVYNGYKNEFQPNALVSRGEALVLINRVFTATFGNYADPLATNRIDGKHWSAAEAKQLFGNLNSMFYTNQRMYIKYNPAENLLYYLHLSANGKKMKNTEKTWHTWSVTGPQLNQPLSREEASAVFFHVLSPYIAHSFNVKPWDVEARFDSFYAWKQPTKYTDTISPYATALQEYAIYTPNEKVLEPAKKMTRAEFAVTLKRLHDVYLRKITQQTKIDKLNFFLTAATYAYKKNSPTAANYFQQDALNNLQDAATKLGVQKVFLHDYKGVLTISDEHTTEFKVRGEYNENSLGLYDVVYYIKYNDNSKNLYGWEIFQIEYTKK